MSKKLLTTKKFWPIFWTQFLGAMNDNIFKNALVLLFTFKATSILGLKSEQMVALCGGLFILPFFLFSALSGELTDKFSMHLLVRFTKILELVTIFIGAFGFYYELIPLLLFALFLLGLQSTLFGPVKYSILPELLTEEELVTGNALVEMGTFLAILVGTIVGGVLIARDPSGNIVSVAGVVVALFGVYTAYQVKHVGPLEPNKKINFNFFTSTFSMIQTSRKIHSVFISILGISWFWFFGAALLSLFPSYVKNSLYGDETVVTLLLAIFSVGVAIGSIICERLSHERLELGLVPFGSIGLSVFLLDLYFSGSLEVATSSRSISELLAISKSYRILFDLAGLSIMSGFFIVPLYTFIQSRCDRKDRAQVIAANNILNALFMVASAGLLVLLYGLGLSTVDVFLVLFALNTIVAIYIYTVIPEFLLRFICVIVSRLIYRPRVYGHKNIPTEGPGILICNHVSFVDWLLIAALVKRPLRFVMHYSFASIPIFKFFFRDAKVIPIAGTKENPQIMEEAFAKIKQTLDEGELICIFPEGQITKDGKLNAFRPGIERILSQSKVPVVPMILHGLWGSFFSRKYGKAATNVAVVPRRIWSKIVLTIDPAQPGEIVTAKSLEEHTQKMLDQAAATSPE